MISLRNYVSLNASSVLAKSYSSIPKSTIIYSKTHARSSLQLTHQSLLLSRRPLHILQSPSASLPPSTLDASKFVKNVPEFNADPTTTSINSNSQPNSEISTSVSHSKFLSLSISLLIFIPNQNYDSFFFFFC